VLSRACRQSDAKPGSAGADERDMRCAIMSRIPLHDIVPGPVLAAWRNRGVSLKAVSFAMVGVVNTLVDLGVFLLAYGEFGVALIPANMLSWLVAVSGSYVMNSFVTFSVESGRKLRWRDYGTFVASGIAGAVANTTALVVASKFLPIVFAKFIAILASFVVNFLLTHLVVFHPRRKQAGDAR
jgi:putative flippase GtrA